MIKQKVILLLFSICLVMFSQCSTVFPIVQIDNLTCEFSQRGSKIFKRSVQLSDDNLNNHLKIYGAIQKSNGTVIMKVIPTYGTQGPSNIQIINRLSMNFRNFTAYEQGGYFDLQGIFQYKNQQIVNIKKIKEQRKLTQIAVVFYRVDRLQQGGLQFIHNLDTQSCYESKVIYSITDQINSYSCPICISDRISEQYQNNQCDVRTGRCQCQTQYIGYDCSINSHRILQEELNKTYEVRSKFQKQYFYYISDSSDNVNLKMQSYTEDLVISTLISQQNITRYPYVTVASIYNCDRELSRMNSFESSIQIKSNHIILVTVTNLSDRRGQFSISVTKNQSMAIFIIKTLLIIAGVLLGSAILVTIICYCCNQNAFSKRLVANIDNSAEIFPTIKYSIFQKYISELKPSSSPTSKLIFNLESSQRQMQDQQNICAICLEAIKEGSQIKYTYCNHILDAKCLESWMQRQENCPLCRENFKFQNVLQWQNKIKKYLKIAISQMRQRRIKKKKKKDNQMRQQGKQRQQAKNTTQQLRQLQINNTYNSINNTAQKKYNNDDEQHGEYVNSHYQKSFDNSNELGMNTFKPQKKYSNPQSLVQSRNSGLNIGYDLDQDQDTNQISGIAQQVYVFYKGIWLYHHQIKQQKGNKNTIINQKIKAQEITDPNTSCKKIQVSLSDLPTKQLKQRNYQRFEDFYNQQQIIDNNNQQTLNRLQKMQSKQDRIESEGNFIVSLDSSLQNSSRKPNQQQKLEAKTINQRC